MDEGVSWYSTGVDYASPQENTVAALALVHHATSTGSEQLLKEHMTDIMTARWTTPPTVRGDLLPRYSPRWPPSLGVRPAKMLASLVAA